DTADGDLREGTTWIGSGDQRDFGHYRRTVWSADHHFGEGAGSMRRRTFALALAFAGCSRDPRPRLNVFNWSSYIAPETVPDFEKEFGVRVRYSLYESNEEMLAKVMTGNSGWDIVFPTHSRIQPMIRNGLLAQLDHSRLRNL